MTLPPAVIVHSLPDARRALGLGRPVTLLSPPGAALYLGAAYWRAIVDVAHREQPDVIAPDILDCADAPGAALGALRIGLARIVLWRTAPARAAVLGVAEAIGATVLETAPPALDLVTWLRRPSG